MWARAQIRNPPRAAERLGAPAVQMDVTDVSSVRAGVDRVVSELVRLDILVNNAGVNVPQVYYAPCVRDPGCFEAMRLRIPRR